MESVRTKDVEEQIAYPFVREQPVFSASPSFLKFSTVIVTALLSMLFLFSCGRSEKNDLAKFNLKGKVKSVTEFYYVAQEKDGEYLRQGRTHGESQLFDSKENEEAVLSYGTVVYFSEQGFRTELQVEASAEVHLLFRELFSYDKKGNLLKRENYGQDELQFIDTFAYDNERREIGHWAYDRERVLLEMTETTYADKQVKSIMKGILEEGDSEEVSLLYTKIATLDKNGNVIQQVRRGIDGAVFDKREASYDRSGRLLEETFYDAENIAYQKTISTYDEHGNESTFDVLDLIDNSFIVRYSYKYQYDSGGNWMEQVALINGVVDNITIRNIEYYE